MNLISETSLKNTKALTLGVPGARERPPPLPCRRARFPAPPGQSLHHGFDGSYVSGTGNRYLHFTFCEAMVTF